MSAGAVAALPHLPSGLEYRFFDRDLVLLDVDLDLVIDLLPDALLRSRMECSCQGSHAHVVCDVEQIKGRSEPTR